MLIGVSEFAEMRVRSGAINARAAGRRDSASDRVPMTRRMLYITYRDQGTETR